MSRLLRSRQSRDQWLWLLLSATTCVLAVLLYRSNTPLVLGPPEEVTKIRDSWDVKHHLGGINPWVPRTPQGLNGSNAVPEGCVIDQVHLMSRHGERYPTLAPGIRMLELYQRLQHANITFAGDLAFVNTWNFFAPFPNKQFEQLTTTGPYAGTLSAFTAGVKLRTKYLHLLEQGLANGQTSFWASDSNRVIETAKYFASGFFGLDWASRATLHIIPESLDQASNTLTPGRACRDYFNNVNSQGRSYGAAQLLAFGKTYLPAVSERLRKRNPDIVFSSEEVYSMQEMCGFETLVHGKSPWCDVFTRDEWDSFEYARDLQHYYRAGPGNPYGASLGFLWLNATTNLLQSGPAVAGPLFLSFNHDGDILTLLAALDLFPQDSHLPTSHVQHDRAWRLSDVTPMHGRIALERMTCAIEKKCWSNPIYPNHVYCNEDSGQDTLETFVRIDVNDAIVPIPGCVSGPGGSCPLEEFAERVSKRGKELKRFKEMCGNGESGEEGIKFLHQ